VPAASEPTKGAWAWAVLAAAMGLWELQAFLQCPRRDHPTLSSLSNEYLESYPARASAFLLWLAAGIWLARR
jgi:hypothetical protein